MLLRDPGEKTTLDRDGWLFYTPDVQYLVEPLRFDAAERSADPVVAIVRFRDQLASRGIDLLVIPLPAKPGIYPEMLALDPTPNGALKHTHTQRLLTRLRDRGVETADLLQHLESWRTQGAGYLQRDTHWSPNAARKAAEWVAAGVRTIHPELDGSTQFTTKPISVRRRGDLVRMMGAPQLESVLPAELVHCEQVISKQSGELYHDDPHSAVLVLGDSYLRMYQTDEPKAAGFIAHLARQLGTPVATIVNDGGASTLVRRQLARSPELLLGKKLVIWEFVERDIRFGAEGWQDVPLPDAP